ncbi:hypothetical protein G789_05081, partial [Escherichia coli HVH 130 (4-7036876)]
MMTLAGKNLRLFQPVPGKSKRMSPQAPLYPAMRAWPCGFSVMWPQRRVRAVPCLHRSRASAGGLQGK